MFNEQIKVIEKDNEGLDERQLVIYNVFHFKYKLKSNNWIASTELYKTYNSKDDSFKILLIGLDGGIELSNNSLHSKNELFSTINGMHMRSAKLKNKE